MATTNLLIVPIIRFVRFVLFVLFVLFEVTVDAMDVDITVTGSVGKAHVPMIDIALGFLDRVETEIIYFVVHLVVVYYILR